MSAPLSRMRRNAVTGLFSCTQLFAASRSMLCSSVRTAISISSSNLVGFKSLGLRKVRQAQDALGNDVRLHLLGAAEDREGLAEQPAADGRQLLRLEGVALPAQALMAHDLERHLMPLLDQRGAGV